MILPKGQSRFKILVAALIGLVLGAGLFGLGYRQGRRVLRQEMTALAAKEIKPARANYPGQSSLGQVMPPMPRMSVRANAPPEMKEFMQNRATLMEKMAELRQQNPNANGAPDPKIFAQFQQENATLMQRQRELSHIIAQQQAKNPMPSPPPLQIPPNASPQLKDYLTTRDQLMRDQIAFMNQHRTDDPATRQAAMQQWRQQNAALFQQLQQQAQAMAQTTASAIK